MKEGWTYKKLGEIATDMYRGSGIKRDQVTKEGMPCVRYGEIYTTYNIGFDKCVSHTDLSQISSPKYFEHGDLLFAITGESVEDIGKTIAYLGHEKCLSGGDIVVLKHNQDPKYLSYALSAPNAIKQKGLGKTKLKVVHTNIPALKEIVIPIPPLDKQQRIVSRLDAAFAYIDELKANAEKQLSEARVLFQKASDKALCNDHWKKTTLNELCIQITDGTHRTPKYTTSGIPFLSVKNVTSGIIDMINTKFISKEEHNEFIKRCNPEYGDILYTKVGTTGVAKVIDVKQEFSIFVSLALLKINESAVFNRFLEYVLNSPYVYKQSQKLTSGAANRNFLLNDIKKVELFVPSLSEQQRIVSRLDAISAHIRELEEVLQKTIAECDALKQALLRKVFE